MGLKKQKTKYFMQKILWYSLPIEKIFGKLKTTKIGLTEAEANKRLAQYGPNKLPEEQKLSAVKIFLNQFKSPLVYVLLGAALISLILQDFSDAVIIMAGVLINTFLGFFQENKANKAITYLRRLIDLEVTVLRNSNKIKLNAKYLVPGDVVLLRAGDKIAADGRIIDADNFQVVEAALTGESIPSNKNSKILAKGAALMDRENMVYSGTAAVRGKATVVVCETGINSEIGQITQLVSKTKEEKTPLQKQLASFGKTLTYIVLAVCAFIIILGKLQGRVIFGFGPAAREGMLNTAAAVAVAAIPEGLLIAVTTILSIGMQAILKKNALVRRLVAAETLGSTSIICSDKTGTLTEGKMQVSHIVTFDKEIKIKEKPKYRDVIGLVDHDLILKIAVLCNDAAIQNPDDELAEWKIIGDPTESALLLAAIQSGIPYHKLARQQKRLMEIPFDTENKFMATLTKLDDKTNVLYVKGAPEKILNFSKIIRINGVKEELTENRFKLVKSRYEKLSSQGLRLLGFAYKKIDNHKVIKNLSDELNDLVFVGFIALKDPLRPEAKEAIDLAKRAGIRTIIVTGDHKLTAKAIFTELGYKIAEKDIIEGEDLDKMSDDVFFKKISDIDIYARVSPKHKLRIIQTWQKKGEVVAMTGDGVNDAPALKSADIGISLGSSTDIAKETSDLILLDNNFRTIIAAVERGRIIFDNIKKTVLYLLADSFTEIVLIVGSLIMGLPLPILPAQIVWVNLIDDGFPGVAIAFEPGEKEVMKDKPRKKMPRYWINK